MPALAECIADAPRVLTGDKDAFALCRDDVGQQGGKGSCSDKGSSCSFASNLLELGCLPDGDLVAGDFDVCYVTDICAEGVCDLVAVGVNDRAGISASNLALAVSIARDDDALCVFIKIDVEAVATLPELRGEGNPLKP